MKILKCKQTGPYISYEKEFKELAIDIRRLGDAEEFRTWTLNALFIIGLNQDQFKERLQRIYGENVWPEFGVLSAELHTYSESTERVNDLLKENNEGRVSAHLSKPEKREFIPESRRACWNCGSGDHVKYECPKPQSKCGKCGKVGHLEKYCLKGTSNVRESEKTGICAKKSFRSSFF
jgi:hypothetical protein